MNSDGWREDYEQKLKAHQEAKLAAISPFMPFNEFPADIRYIIWKYSLPGPRTICPGNPRIPDREAKDMRDHERYVKERKQLVFPKDHHAPNPAALSVCRESRHIALQKYRLCFGTPNAYADFEIDIFYFGPWYILDLVGFWSWTVCMEPFVEFTQEFAIETHNAAVKTDLELVQRVGIKHKEGRQEYDDFIDSPRYPIARGGYGLRRDLRGFKSLKEVLLSDGSCNENFRHWEPGHTVVSDFDVKLEEPDWDNMSDDDSCDSFEEQLRQRSERVFSDFRTKNLTAEEEEHGVPEIKLVTFEQIPDIPWVPKIPTRFLNDSESSDENMEELPSSDEAASSRAE
jgi:hypothetical protein